jgi:hypothetical protein
MMKNYPNSQNIKIRTIRRHSSRVCQSTPDELNQIGAHIAQEQLQNCIRRTNELRYRYP